MAEDRLDRIESNLERHAEESNQRMTRLERFLANFSKDVARNAADANERLDSIEKLIAHNAQQIAHNAQQIAQLSQEMSFLRTAAQGHISQPTPPAHSD